MNRAYTQPLQTWLLASLCLLLLPWHARAQQQTKYYHIVHSKTGTALQDNSTASFSAASADRNNNAQIWTTTFYKEEGKTYVSLASNGPKGYRIGFTGVASMVGFTTGGGKKQFQFERRGVSGGYVLISRLYPTHALHVDRYNNNRLSLQTYKEGDEAFVWKMTEVAAPN